jgi:hypothetical protein
LLLAFAHFYAFWRDERPCTRDVNVGDEEPVAALGRLAPFSIVDVRVYSRHLLPLSEL